MKTNHPAYITLLHPSISNQKLLSSTIHQLYTKTHIITPLLLPPSIIICVSDQLHTINNKNFPSLHLCVEFNQYNKEGKKIFLTSSDTDFISWYSSLQNFFPPSIHDEFLIPYRGFFLTEDERTQQEITCKNKDWFIATYAITYTKDEDRVVSFYREKLEQKHIR